MNSILREFRFQSLEMLLDSIKLAKEGKEEDSAAKVGKEGCLVEHVPREVRVLDESGRWVAKWGCIAKQILRETARGQEQYRKTSFGCCPDLKCLGATLGLF